MARSEGNREDSEVVTKKFLVVDTGQTPIEPEAGHYVGDIKVTVECPGAKDTKVYYTTHLTKTPAERPSNPTMNCGIPSLSARRETTQSEPFRKRRDGEELHDAGALHGC